MIEFRFFKLSKTKFYNATGQRPMNILFFSEKARQQLHKGSYLSDVAVLNWMFLHTRTLHKSQQHFFCVCVFVVLFYYKCRCIGDREEL